MSNFNLKFENEYKIATKALRINGSSPFVQHNIWFKIQTIVNFITSAWCFIFLLYSIIVADLPKKNYEEVIKNSIIVNVGTTVAFKYCLLIYYRRSLLSVIKSIDEDYEKAKHFTEQDQSVILEYSRRGKRISIIWFWIATYSCCIFPVKALYLMAHAYVNGDFKLVPMFDLVYPSYLNDNKDELPVYLLLFGMTFLFAIFAGSVFIGFDPLVPIFLLHACAQLHLLRQQILNVFSSEKTPNMTRDELKQINVKLAHIYRFVKKVQNIFTVVNELNLKATTFLIPFTAFINYQAFRNCEINLEFNFFFVGSLVHFYFPCYYSDLLMEASEMTRQTIYSCGWENTTDKNNRKIILFMLTRTATPLVIRTIFFPICLNTFSEMCRQAYTIYNIMNAAWL